MWTRRQQLRNDAFDRRVELVGDFADEPDA